MGRFRSALRRHVRNVVKPAVMVFVASTVAVSLVVTTPSNAQALVLPTPVLPSVFGATELALPELMATESLLGPVGWGLAALTGAAALGVAAYETRDTWVPWVEGTFGQSTPTTGPAASGAHTYADVAMQNVKFQNKGAYFEWHYSGTNYTNGAIVLMDFTYDCTNDTTHVVRSGLHYNFSGTFGNGMGAYPTTGSTTLGCSGGETMTSFMVGAYGSNPQMQPYVSGQNPGPNNVVGIGGAGTAPFDPHSSTVQYKTTVECVSDTGSKVSISRTWTGDSPGLVIPSCEAAGLGHGDGGMTVIGTPPNQAPTTLLTRTPVAPSTTYPLCGPTVPGPGCKLQVLVDGKPCVQDLWECVNWMQIDQSRVQCYYGPYSVAISECNELKRAYEGQGVPVTGDNISTTPGVGNDTNLNGQPNPARSQTTTTPGGAGSPDPVTGTTAVPLPGSTAENNGKDCWPSGWGMFNPLEWITGGINCAFVPKADVQAKVQAAADGLGAKAPFSWMTGANAMVAGSSAISGACPDWTVYVGSYSKNLVCDSSFTQAILNSRGALFGLMVIAMFWPLIRSLWYAVIPILRPTPMSS